MTKFLEWFVYTLFFSIPCYVFIRRYSKTYPPDKTKQVLKYIITYIAVLAGFAAILPVDAETHKIIILTGITPLIFVDYMFRRRHRLTPEEAQQKLQEITTGNYKFWLKVCLMLLLVLILITQGKEGWQWPLTILVVLLVSVVKDFVAKKGQ